MQSNEIRKVKIILEKIKDNRTHIPCGYCHGIRPGNGYKTFRLVSNDFPADICDKMYMNGWYRSCDLIEKHSPEISCCKLYSIRLNVQNFKISKTQKKIMKRFRKYLNGTYEKPQPGDIVINIIKDHKKKKDVYQNDIDNIVRQYIQKEKVSIKDKEEMKKVETIEIKNKNFGDYSNNLLIIIGCMISKEQDNKKNIDTIRKEEFNLFNDYFTRSGNNKYTISLSSNTGHLNFKVVNTIEYNEFLLSKKQKHIYKSKNPLNKKDTNKNFNKKKYEFEYFPEIVNEPEIYLPLKHTYTMELSDNIRATPEKFALFKKYSDRVHQQVENIMDDYDYSWGFSNITSHNLKIPYPEDFKSKVKHPEIFPPKYGTYNILHRIDNKLVAVGIWDILPTSLISIYLYYDPDYLFLDLGVFTAIREIEYVKAFHDLIDPNFIYYNIDQFCATCPKMCYKEQFSPMEVLCPFTMNYVYLSDVIDKLKADKYEPLSKEPKNPNYVMTEQDVDNIVNNLTVEVNGIEINFNIFLFTYLEESMQEKIVRLVKKLIFLLGYELSNYIQLTAFDY